MSDIADRAADSCGAIAGAGGRFVQREQCVPVAGRTLRACECGGRPVYRSHPPLRAGGKPLETLTCGACGNAVGPFASRQLLAAEWQGGGYSPLDRESGETTGCLLVLIALAALAAMAAFWMGTRPVHLRVEWVAEYPNPVCERCGQVLDGTHNECIEEGASK